MRPLVIVSLAVVAVAAAGCYWPIPSCTSFSGPKEYRYDGFEMSKEANGYRLHRKIYATCMDLCAAQPGVSKVHHCTEPEVAEASPNPKDGPLSFKFTCDVEGEMCELPEIIEPLSFH